MQYSQRALMKISRFVKLRTFSHGPEDLALEQTHNPLKRKVPVLKPTHEFTARFLEQFKTPLDLSQAQEEP